MANVLFLTLVNIENLSSPNLYSDLLREFSKHSHKVYIATAYEKRNGKETELFSDEFGTILRIKTGNIQKTNLIEKGLSTIALEGQYIQAIKKYLSDVKFDLVMYSTPPVTLAKAVEYVKKRDNAKTYLLLKDIFPQNSVDLGMLKTTGIKGCIYNFFKKKERKLYELSDTIGCMSPANVKFLLEQEPWINKEKVEVCPNTEEPRPIVLSREEKDEIRNKYGLPLDKKIFIYGGNLGRPQCVPFIVECLKKTKDAFFVIVGSGTDKQCLDEYIKELHPHNVVLLNAIPRIDFEKLVAASDIGLIFLDYRFTIPNFPSRLLTYLQAGLPVLSCTDISTDVGRIAKTNGFGWSCQSNDADGFAKLAEEINSLPKEELEKMGSLGREYFKNNYTAEISYNIIMRGL